ncbi:MAG: hypothetical protein AB1642_04310 [Pseudomonadota bacterium]
MKRIGLFLALAWAILGAGSAWADGRHHHRHHPHSGVRFSVHLGSPWLFPPYPRFPAEPYWPQAVIVTPPRVVYIEQAAPAVPTLEPGYWYYCAESGAYYPRVATCAGDWRKVAPSR